MLNRMTDDDLSGRPLCLPLARWLSLKTLRTRESPNAFRSLPPTPPKPDPLAKAGCRLSSTNGRPMRSVIGCCTVLKTEGPDKLAQWFWRGSALGYINWPGPSPVHDSLRLSHAPSRRW